MIAFADRIAQLHLCGESILSRHSVPAFRGGPNHVLIRCPQPDHEDRVPSCSVNLAEGTFNCWSCLRFGDAVDLHRLLGDFPTPGDALRDLESSSIRHDSPRLRIAPSSKPKMVATSNPNLRGTPSEVVRRWAYRAANGSPAFDIVRLQYRDDNRQWLLDFATGKILKEYRPTRPGSTRFRMPPGFARPGSRPLLALEQIQSADVNCKVWIVEGEPAASALQKLGWLATTASGGSSSPHLTDWSPLAGRKVVIWPDNDEAGSSYADQLLSCLRNLNPLPQISVVDIDLLGLPIKGDAWDWVHGRKKEVEAGGIHHG